ncbi:MAG: UDP-glucose/GDP-mannose dehydrogenase family protein [Actinomycetota bacterium]
MKICIIGVGYVGLVTGACFADIGHDVICVDVDSDKISKLRAGIIPIYEPGLDQIVTRNQKTGRIMFSTDITVGVQKSDMIFITVGTPPDKTEAADLTHVKAAAGEIARAMNGYKVIVNKSTMPLGSTKLVQGIIEESKINPHHFEVVSNPEFLREGSAVEDFLHPDRIIIGTHSQKAAEVMTELYSPFNAPVLVMDPVSAELIKYASNAFLATKISFINAIANICEKVGADVREVALGMGYDKRIGFEFFNAGPGWGGSCLPKDCKALVKIAENYGYDFQLLKGTIQINENQKRFIVTKVRELLGNLKGKDIGILGLSFKPNTDDIRDSPAIDIVRHLRAEGASIKAYDPVAMENAEHILKGVKFVHDAYEAAKDSDILLLLTEWDHFKWLDFKKIKSLLKKPILFDARNYLDSNALKHLGFIYRGVGR